MKKYRVLLPHSWTERPGGGTINGQPGEMAVISDEVFAAAPPGTFALLPGEDGYVPPFIVMVDDAPVEFHHGVVGPREHEAAVDRFRAVADSIHSEPVEAHVAAEAPAPVSDAPETASAPVEAPEAVAAPIASALSPPKQRKPKAEAFKPKPKKRK